jgi:hypothetical protein
MDDKELAVASLVLLGTTIESHLEHNLTTPIFYQALDLAIEISQRVGVAELTDRLTCLQIEVGEHNAKVREMLEKISESGDFDTLIENLTNLSDIE